MASTGIAAFFSYSRDDSSFVVRLAADLKAAGANVWLDQLDIIPGQRWDHAIEDALKNCPTLIVILSPCGAQKFHSEVSNEMSHCYIASVSCGITGEMTIRQRQAILRTGQCSAQCRR